MTTVMTLVSKSQVKAKILEYFRQVEKSGEELVITDNRKPVLKIVPFKKKKSVEELFGDIRGKVEYYEDPWKDTSEEWGNLI